jgi:MurNAc alpha-1-phosphate uridylyltransferase
MNEFDDFKSSNPQLSNSNSVNSVHSVQNPFSTKTLPIAILAGGLATRLRPLTERIPKALVEVAGRPFVDWQLELLAAGGMKSVVFCVGYLGEMIEAHVGDGARFGLEVAYCYDGPALLGTAGALRQALPLLGQNFLVLYGDSYLQIDYAAVTEAFLKSGKPGLMTVLKNEGRWDSSNVWMDSGEIRLYDKKARLPEMQHIDYGLTAFRAKVFSRRGAEAFDLAELMRELVANKEMSALEVTQRFYEIGSPEGIADLDAHLLPENRRPAIFFDRDGVINEVVMRDGVACSPREASAFRFKPGIREAFQAARDAGFLRIIVTNQPDVERGQIARHEYEAMQTLVRETLQPDGFEACEASSNADRRKKPNPGMLLDAAAQLGVDLKKSWIVGDTWKDVQAGRSAGVRSILLATDYNTEVQPTADFCFSTLGDIASFISSLKTLRTS